MKNLGIMTAVISPMLADGVTVNEKALTAILEDQITKGAGSLLLLGGTGENTAVPKAARTKILELAVKVIDHRAPVVAGVVELGVYEAIESAKAAKAATSTTEAGRVGDRPYARGRSYKADRYDETK